MLDFVGLPLDAPSSVWSPPPGDVAPPPTQTREPPPLLVALTASLGLPLTGCHVPLMDTTRD